jgi:hypothetical protein
VFFLYVTVQSTEIKKNGVNGNEVAVLNIFISLHLTPCSYLPQMTPFNKSRLKRGQLITFLWTTLVLRKTIKINNNNNKNNNIFNCKWAVAWWQWL